MNKKRKDVILSFLTIFISINELILFIKIFFTKKKCIIVNSNRIGHLLSDPLGLKKYFQKDEKFKKKFIIIFPKKTSNIFLQEKIINLLKNNNFFCYESNLDEFLSRILIRKHKKELTYIAQNLEKYKLKNLYLNNNFKAFYMPKIVYEEGKIFNKHYKSDILFSDKEKLREDLVLEKYNLKNLKKNYVCFLARDQEYLSKTSEFNSSYHDYRNSNYLDLLPSINFIIQVKKNIVLRMGNIKKKLDKKIFSQKHIDVYDNSFDGFEDISLIKNCKFFVCDSAGIATVATGFNIPVLRHNWIPISNSSAYRTLIIPKIIINKFTKEKIEFKKIFKDYAKGNLYLMRNSDFYKQNNLEVLDNETEIILETIKEMFIRVESGNNFDIEDEAQIKFELWLKEYDIYNPGLLSKAFKDKYKALIS